MRMRPIHSAAVAFVAALAVTVGSPGPAEAFLPLPISIPMLQQSQPPVESRSSGRSPSDNNLRKRSDRGSISRPARQAVHWHAREARRGMKLRLLGQERQVAGEIRGHLAGHAHPQRPAGAACEQEQRPRQRRGAPRKPRRRKEHAARHADGPAQRDQRELWLASAQSRPRRQHTWRYIRRGARRYSQLGR